MHPLLRLGYGAAGEIARALAVVAPPGESKLLRTLRARRGIRERFARWGVSGRDSSRPLLWMHAPSVGEGLQARPVLQHARAARPDVQLAYTFFSPSAASFARSLEVDFADYLPFDTGGDVAAALDALRPRALVFSKLDVWPVLVQEADARGVGLGLISATLAAGSTRRGRLAAAALRDAYARLDAVGAIDEDDAERLASLGTPHERISVTGDVRYDQVWARARTVNRDAGLVATLTSARPTLVAGSTWPADERPLLAAWRRVRARIPDARLVIAPHEPTATHVDPIERWAADAGLTSRHVDDARAPNADVVVVDRVGVLGELYALADVAFVGGGFHSAGLHSVVEPAAFGAPVLFGPVYAGSRDARILLRDGGGFTASTVDLLADDLAGLLGDERSRREAGSRARDVVERGLGAAERSWRLVEGLLR